MNDRTPLPPINFTALAEALLARAAELVNSWLPGGTQRGHEYICGSLSGGSGDSCAVNLTTGKWADFSTDERGGDLVGLYAVINGLTMGKAAVQVAREEGLEDVAGVQPARSDAAPVVKVARVAPAPVVRATEEGWVAVVPVPAHAPAATFHHPYRVLADIEHTATYEIDGALQGYVVRFRTSDGGKETLPYTWCTSAKDGGSRWHWKTWDEPRPLYFPGGVTPLAAVEGCFPLPTVILVEGEKKAGVLQDLLTAHAPGVYLVASWSGGCKAWKKADWHWLAGCTVLLWPDCDGKRVPLTKAEREDCANLADKDMAQATKPLLPTHKQPGMAAMLGIGALLRSAHGCTVSLLPIPEPLTVVDGWDCADAINTNGWTAERVLQLFAGAFALPADGADVEPVQAGKKSKVSLPLEGGVIDAGSFIKFGGYGIPDWLTPYYNKEKKFWMVSRKMVIKILECDLKLLPVLAYNELSNSIQTRVLWPWPHSRVGDMASSADLLLGDYLTDVYGLPSIPRAQLSEAIQTVANKRRFHPVREYLQGLKWDGTSRIDKWLIHILGESLDSLSPAMAEYFQLVGRYWLLGMVNRVMEPGCKFDYCPVLEGKGGLFKSTMVKILGSKDFYSDTPFEVGHGKEAQEQVQGLWLYEIAEMANFSKSEVGSIKAFISSEVDRYRVAYGTTVEKFPRQCVLVGTTNEKTYLRDRTGNRRFWPIPVKHEINTVWLQKYRDQLFAEAFELYGQRVRYTPKSSEEKRLFAPMQESRLVESPVHSELLRLLTRDPTGSESGLIVNNLADFLTVAQIIKALDVDVAKSTPALDNNIRSWLEFQGWVSNKKQILGVRNNGYSRPAKWPSDEVENDMERTPLKAVLPTTEPGDDEPF